MEVPDFYDQLRKEILLACEIEQATIEDCKTISIKIFTKDRNYISESTMKRFFGFLPSARPSLFVLNSLSAFIGLSSWEKFKNNIGPKNTEEY